MNASSNRRQQLLEELAEPVCAAHGVELVEIRQARGHGGTTIRVTIDRERPASDPTPGSGVTLEDCKGVSRDLSTALDLHEEDMPAKYHLEVSSPGLERPLVKLKDFERFSGKEIKLKTREPIEPPVSEETGGKKARAKRSRKSFQGLLKGVHGEEVELELDGTLVRIPHAAIVRAHLVYRFEPPRR